MYREPPVGASTTAVVVGEPHDVTLPGGGLRIWPVTVGAHSTSELHVLVPDPFGYLNTSVPENLLTQLERDFAGGRLSIVVAEREGFAMANPSRTEDSFHVAAAVAVMKAKCSWDESDAIEVVVDGASVKVSVAFDETTWRAWPVG